MNIKFSSSVILSFFLLFGNTSGYAAAKQNKCAGFYNILLYEDGWRNFYWGWTLVYYTKQQAEALMPLIPAKRVEVEADIAGLEASLEELAVQKKQPDSKKGIIASMKGYFLKRDLEKQLEKKKESLGHLDGITVKLKDKIDTFASGLATPSFRGFAHPRFTIASEHPNKSTGKILGSTDMMGLGFTYRLIQPNTMEFEGNSRGMGAKYSIKVLPLGGIELDGGIAGIWANYRTEQVMAENNFIISGETRGIGSRLEISNPKPNVWRAVGSQAGRGYDYTLEFTSEVPNQVQKLLFIGSAIHM